MVHPFISTAEQHVTEKALGVGYANGEGAHADVSERAVADNDDRRRWIELHDVLHSRLNVTDKVSVDEI